MEKARCRTAVKNLDSGNLPVLDDFSDYHLSTVISDSCVVFVPRAGTLSVALSLLRAKEQAQVALTEAAGRKEAADAERLAREATQSQSADDGTGVPALSKGKAVALLSEDETPLAELMRRTRAKTCRGMTSQGVSTRSKSRNEGAKRSMLAARKGRTKRLVG